MLDQEVWAYEFGEHATPLFFALLRQLLSLLPLPVTSHTKAWTLALKLPLHRKKG